MTETNAVWVDQLITAGATERCVRFTADETGTIRAKESGTTPKPGDLVLGTAVPGFGNAHSHVFHRALRGRTHSDGGTFWTWREAMYRLASRLDPDSYRTLATAVFSEMVANGWTAVGEFHYLHHQQSGEQYPDDDMEMALADAAEAAGIRLVLLDTCYLEGGIGQLLGSEQQRFGDGTAERWLERWHGLNQKIAQRSSLVTLGAALHSVRAVSREAAKVIVSGLPTNVPLHIHLSEQPAENAQALAHYGLTPTEILAADGILGERVSVIHATHLTAQDIETLAAYRVHAVFCPTTEADLGDGIGPALELRDTGVRLAVGSDQNAVIDPLLELRGLESGERLRSLTRGRFTPDELLDIGTGGGYGSLGLGSPASLGGPLDLVELDPESMRTAGSLGSQLVLAAAGSDVLKVVVSGQVRHEPGQNRSTSESLVRALWSLQHA